MSCILYYSKYCEISKKYLQMLSKSNMQNDIHFICIDKRIKDSNNKTFIILDNGQQIILPENITRVPALLLLNQGYNVLYGEQILNYFKPKQQEEVKYATKNNMEPLSFSFGYGGFSDIVSDKYSYLDQHEEDLKATGNGGMRQMHNYVDLDTANRPSYMGTSQDDFNTTIRGGKKMQESESNELMEDKIKKMREQRDADIKLITGNRPPII